MATYGSTVAVGNGGCLGEESPYFVHVVGRAPTIWYLCQKHAETILGDERKILTEDEVEVFTIMKS